MKKYYKTNCKKVLGATSDMNQKKDELVNEANKVAANFNAKAMTSTSTDGVRFGGLVLNNYHGGFWGSDEPIRSDKLLWTAPNSNSVSWPRTSLTKKHFESLIRGMDDQSAKELMKAKRLELKLLQDEYAEMTKGVESVSFDSFFESIGTDWGNLMFSGLNWFECDGFVYLASGMDLSSSATEILGSEFELAQSKSKGKS